MRGNVVVLALALSFVSVSAQAQGHSRFVKHDKCAEKERGNPSETGLANRADPRTKGNKDCATTPPGGGGGGAQPGVTIVFGTLYNDLNGNGYRDAGEPGLDGWSVRVSGGPSAGSATTDASGAYSIGGLTAGMYTLCVSPPSGWTQTAPSSGPSCGGSAVGLALESPAVFGGDVWQMDFDFGFRQ